MVWLAKISPIAKIGLPIAPRIIKRFLPMQSTMCPNGILNKPAIIGPNAKISPMLARLMPLPER